MSTGTDVALRKGFHKLTAYDMAAKCRAMLDARPTCEFAALEPGKTYCYRPPYGNRFELASIPMSPCGPNETGRRHIDSPRRFWALLRIHVLRIG
jgi:hypothetical protein